MSSRLSLSLLSMAFFLGLVLLLLVSAPDTFFYDTDTAWHLAAGRLIVAQGALPANHWSFTAPDHTWINLAWLWDVAVSKLYDHMGWQGPVLLHTITLALTFLLLFITCLIRSQHGIASFLSVLLVLLAVPLSLRPLCVSNLFLALIFLIANLVQHRGFNIRWWYVMPALMPLWVNIHGGFIIAFGLLGAYGFQALYEKNWRHANHLAAAGVLSLLACAASPFGMVNVFHAVFLLLHQPSLQFIREFMPTILISGFFVMQLFVPVFVYFVMRYGAIIGTLSEKILVFGFFVLGCLCVRYWPFFFLFAAPMLACYIARSPLARKREEGGSPAFKAFVSRMQLTMAAHEKSVLACAALFSLAVICFLATPVGGRAFSLHTLAPYAKYQAALEFAETHYPNTRFLNDYGLSGIMLLESNIPVFLDGRAESAYPERITQDFYHVWSQKPGWEKILERYKIDGLFVYTHLPELRHVADQRPGWRKAYSDEEVSIFVREK